MNAHSLDADRGFIDELDAIHEQPGASQTQCVVFLGQVSYIKGIKIQSAFRFTLLYCSSV